MRRSSMMIPALLALALPVDLLAAPRGVAIAPMAIPGPQRAQLRRQVAEARKRDPRAFEALTQLRARLPQIAARQRGRLVTVVLPLRSLGARALMPMLSELCLDGRLRGGLDQRTWRGWQTSLLEAVGSLRDARARPALEALLAAVDPGREAQLFRGAAVALGRLGDDRAAATLIRLARQARTRRAVLPGLGQCRRTTVARELAAILSQATDDPTLASAAAAALGQIANLWAWQTPAVARSAEALAVRTVALEGLVASYPRLSPPAREVAVKAIKLVGHKKTLPAISAAQLKTSGAARAALDALAARIAAEGVLR
jgi:hypothetical protein